MRGGRESIDAFWQTTDRKIVKKCFRERFGFSGVISQRQANVYKQFSQK
jgi:hypothetical protein